MNNECEEGFYLYHACEGTYQRYVERDTSYELDQSYFKYKEVSHQRFAIICVLSVLLLVAIFIIINMFIKNRELKVDLGIIPAKSDRKKEDEDDEDGNNDKQREDSSLDNSKKKGARSS